MSGFEVHSNIFLEAKALAIGYGSGKSEKRVASELDIVLHGGEMVCLLGPNGAGKSTLLRTLSGVQKPLAGEVLVKGDVLANFSRSQLAKVISLVLTDKVQAGNLTAFDVVALGRYPHTGWQDKLESQDLAQINWAFEATGSEVLRYEKINEMSDGQQQKIMIARALAQDGDIIILDEPTAHLDIGNRTEIMQLLKTLAEVTGKAILVATHELDLALQTADQLWLMRPHQRMATGLPEDLALQGELSASFDSAGLQFDLKEGRFKTKKSFYNSINVSGTGNAYIWTLRALNRIGLKHDEFANELKLEVRETEDGTIWILAQKDGVQTFSSLAVLIRLLRRK